MAKKHHWQLTVHKHKMNGSVLTNSCLPIDDDGVRTVNAFVPFLCRVAGLQFVPRVEDDIIIRYKGKVLEKTEPDVLWLESVSIPVEGLAVAACKAAYDETCLALELNDHCFMFLERGASFVAFMHKDWILGPIQFMNAIFELDNKKPIQAQMEKVFSRISALAFGKAIIATSQVGNVHVVSPEQVQSHIADISEWCFKNGFDPKAWIEQYHDGSIMIRKSHFEALSKMKVADWAIGKTIRVLIPGKGIAKGNCVVTPDEYMPEGIDILVPPPSLTRDILPHVEWLMVSGLAHETPYFTDPQTLCHLPEIGKYMGLWTREHCVEALASISSTEALLAAFDHMNDDQVEEESFDADSEQAEVSATVREAIVRLGLQAYDYPRLRQEIINTLFGSSTSRRQFKDGRVPVPRTAASGHYMAPDVRALNKATGLIDPRKSELGRNQIDIVKDEHGFIGTVFFNPYDSRNWCGILGGADYDDQAWIFYSGSKFLMYRRPIGHPGQFVIGQLLHSVPVNEQVEELIARMSRSDRWMPSPRLLSLGEDLLKSFETQVDLSEGKYDWSDVFEGMRWLPLAHRALNVGLWAKLSSMLVLLLRASERWMGTHTLDQPVPSGEFVDPRVDINPLSRIAFKDVSSQKFEIYTRKSDKPQVYSLVTILEMVQAKMDWVYAVLAVDERFIDHCNGKPKFPEGKKLDVPKFWEEASKHLWIVKKLATMTGWFSGQSRIYISEMDEPMLGLIPNELLWEDQYSSHRLVDGYHYINRAQVMKGVDNGKYFEKGDAYDNMFKRFFPNLRRAQREEGERMKYRGKFAEELGEQYAAMQNAYAQAHDHGIGDLFLTAMYRLVYSLMEDTKRKHKRMGPSSNCHNSDGTPLKKRCPETWFWPWIEGMRKAGRLQELSQVMGVNMIIDLYVPYAHNKMISMAQRPAPVDIVIPADKAEWYANMEAQLVKMLEAFTLAKVKATQVVVADSSEIGKRAKVHELGSFMGNLDAEALKQLVNMNHADNVLWMDEYMGHVLHLITSKSGENVEDVEPLDLEDLE